MENTLIFIDAGFLSKLSRYFGNGKSSFSRSNHLLKIVSRYIGLTKEDFTNAGIIK